jgi:chromosome segregation ATPase
MVAFVFGAAYMFEMRLNDLYKEVQKREGELFQLKQRNADLETKVDQLEKQNVDSKQKVGLLEKNTAESIQREISDVKKAIGDEQKRRAEIDSAQHKGMCHGDMAK